MVIVRIIRIFMIIMYNLYINIKRKIINKIMYNILFVVNENLDVIISKFNDQANKI